MISEIAFRGLKDVSLYPSVGMRRPQAHLTVNFGQRPFIFDIDGMVAVCACAFFWVFIGADFS